MFSIKEALLAKERSGGSAETAIFYMDMRTFGKDFQRYRERAEKEHGVRFVRSRVHTVEPAGNDGDFRLSYVDSGGIMHDEVFDLVVLATGQKPPAGTEALAEMTGINLNPWGFCQSSSFSPGRTSRDGLFAGGSSSGLKDISEYIVQASSASLGASRLIHSKGGRLAEAGAEEPSYRDVSREPPQVAVALCNCATSQGQATDLQSLAEKLKRSGTVHEVIEIRNACTREGWRTLEETLKGSSANRVLIGACLPYLYSRKLKDLGKATGLSPSLMDVVDIRTPAFSQENGGSSKLQHHIRTLLNMGVAKLRGADPFSLQSIPIVQRGLVVGGGIAGMTTSPARAGIQQTPYVFPVPRRRFSP